VPEIAKQRKPAANAHAYFGIPQLGTPKEAVLNLVESVLGRVGLTIANSEDERDFARPPPRAATISSIWTMLFLSCRLPTDTS